MIIIPKDYIYICWCFGGLLLKMMMCRIWLVILFFSLSSILIEVESSPPFYVKVGHAKAGEIAAARQRQAGAPPADNLFSEPLITAIAVDESRKRAIHRDALLSLLKQRQDSKMMSKGKTKI